MKQIKVSVIIPVYNTEKYLRQCLDSVVSQTLKEIEIICINDGSTDNSLVILKEYKKTDNRIIIIEQENKGAADARNKGLEIAKGEYLYFLDSDDFLELDAFDLLYMNAKTDNLDILLFFKTTYFDDTGEKQIDNYFHEDELPNIFSIKNVNNIYDRISTSAWNKLFRKDFINEHQIEFQNLKTCNDVYFTIKAISVAEKISFINKNLINYRINHAESITKNKGYYSECIFGAFIKLEYELKYLLSNNNEIKESFYKLMVMHICYQYNHSYDKHNFIKIANENLSNNNLIDIFIQLLIYNSKNEEKLEKVNKDFHEIGEYCTNLEKYTKECEGKLEKVNKDFHEIGEYCTNLEKYTKECEGKLEKVNKDYHEIGKYCTNLENRIKELEINNNEYKDKINIMLNSTSWKITKPLRKIKQIFFRNNYIIW